LRVRSAVVDRGIVLFLIAEKGSFTRVVERLGHVDILGPATRAALIENDIVGNAQCLSTRIPFVRFVLRVRPGDRADRLTSIAGESANGATKKPLTRKLCSFAVS